MNFQINKILEMLHIAEKLKQELRHSWLSNGRQESSAEHSWRLALMVLLIAPETNLELDMLKALKMAVIHDLVEAEAYDIPAFEHHRTEEKKAAEQSAADHYKEILSSPAGDEIYDLWIEYEEQTSTEAKFIKSLDKLEVRLQHNEAGVKTWNDIEYPRSLFAADKYCRIDKFIQEFNDQIKNDSTNLITSSNKDIKSVRKEAGKLKKDD